MYKKVVCIFFLLISFNRNSFVDYFLIIAIFQLFLFHNTGIIIRFLGEANTNWSETKKVTDDQGKEHDETEELTGHEEYFENHYYLLGAKNGSEINLPSGEHTYPFSCVLPGNLPSSYEGNNFNNPHLRHDTSTDISIFTLF